MWEVQEATPSNEEELARCFVGITNIGIDHWSLHGGNGATPPIDGETQEEAAIFGTQDDAFFFLKIKKKRMLFLLHLLLARGWQDLFKEKTKKRSKRQEMHSSFKKQLHVWLAQLMSLFPRERENIQMTK